MPRPTAAFVALIALSIGLTPAVVHAATFDFIFADTIDVTTFPSNTGFTLAGSDFGLVVNKGTTDISGSEFFGTTFTATSSIPAVTVHPFINNPGPAITPIHPDEALGSVQSDNVVLTTKLLPGETHHNTAPEQVIAIEVHSPPGFSGQAFFDISMVMGANRAHYGIVANFVFGSDFALAFRSAARVTSVPDATPTLQTSWGRLKSLYR